MGRYLGLLFCFFSLNGIAQGYKSSIEAHRTKYKADFLAEARSPLQAEDLKNLHFYEADSNYSVNASVKILTGEKIFKMPTYDGTSKEFIRYAELNFTLKGKALKITVYKNIALAINPAYKDLLFLPFTDQTNNKETYGGGRYIDLNSNDIKNKRITIDFNKAYNPYCAYSDGYRCPVPPEENDLPIAITAGEKLYTGEKKHK
ncbi:DUF1684 domain-containing protein [Pedobacter sp. Hv1]|uniref:DUF1684 domain-containing protein n=1 Tax=Pedobacter sp. Hv1 TaxID=1740090 RepID=UPI0006D8C88F|nr:DUF1684 domain-containing protein [Pedobacter sp. Hv1]KQC00693.1 hypothetical protein AQF98_08415 [Pedobacter sp. Hv1]